MDHHDPRMGIDLPLSNWTINVSDVRIKLIWNSISWCTLLYLSIHDHAGFLLVMQQSLYAILQYKGRCFCTSIDL
uniref:Uncharacterized protein n=1 Tax=Nelumbo nucifera TaxID=4432 RepID=A0A822YTI2_NELNU|nr:TPA_asm: hypothetical protein HUJ06_006467 [Nelumbo nucifera]